MKCLFIINKSSGNADSINIEKIKKILSQRYDTIEILEFISNQKLDLQQISKRYDAIAISGGDGTFSNALNSLKSENKEIIYLPFGTFNDCFKTLKKTNLETKKLQFIDFTIASCNEKAFSYVCATGSFTPIGYKPKIDIKKIFKRLTYYFYAIKEYKLYNIHAKINIDNSKLLLEDQYTLIMAVKSKYVFGFPFNRIYNPKSNVGELLLIKTPNGLFKYLKMFFLFFRAFFIGFDKEYNGKHIKFLSMKNVDILTDKEQDFCVDGEKFTTSKKVQIDFNDTKVKLGIIL